MRSRPIVLSFIVFFLFFHQILKLMLRKLQTTGRLMQVTAHPDDEDGGMLTLESRGKGVSTLLMTLTRGEGGQNKLGSNLFDVLGVLRTLELLASDRYYGVFFIIIKFPDGEEENFLTGSELFA